MYNVAVSLKKESSTYFRYDGETTEIKRMTFNINYSQDKGK